MAKSFFERLTSTLNLESEEIKEVPLKRNVKKAVASEEVNLEPERKSFIIMEEATEEVSPQLEEQESLPSSVSEPEVSPTPEKEDWLEEAEGQLIVDVYQTSNEIVIKSLIAGVKPEDLDITVANDMITIKGRRAKDEEIKNDNYYYQECYWGSFSRSIILPVDVETEKADAVIKNGILTIRLPKIEKAKTKKIRVRG